MFEISQNSIPVGLHLIVNSVSDAYEKQMVTRWREEYETHQFKLRRRQKVLDAVIEGYDTLSEISSATDVPRATVRRILERFIAQKRIELVRTLNENSRYEMRYRVI